MSQPYTTSPGIIQGQDVTSFDDVSSIEQMHRDMIAGGERVEDRVYVDTFAFGSTEEFVIPGTGGQKIFFKIMNEGAKSEYQKATNKDVRVQRTTGDAKMQVDPAGERHTLLKLSVTGWEVVRFNSQLNKWEAIGYSPKAFSDWLVKADPKIIQDLEKAIRDKNVWMKNEFTVEEYDKQIEELKEKRDALIEEEAKKS